MDNCELTTIAKQGAEMDSGKVNAKNLSELMKQLNVSTRCVGESHAASISMFHFILDNLNDEPKLKRIASPISRRLGVNVSVNDNSPTGDFCLEIERRDRQTVHFRDMLTEGWHGGKHPSLCPFIIGEATTGEHITSTLKESIHKLIAGTTGSGKSVYSTSARHRRKNMI